MRTLDKKEINQLKQKLEQLKSKTGITKLRTAIYTRKSAEDEKQTSIDTQIAQCKQLIASYDFLELLETFSEDNRSGMFADNRTEYQKLMSKAKNKEIDVIVVMKLDRLARDLCDALTTINLLYRCDCYLIAGDDISDSQMPAGEFLRNILLAQNQYYSRRTASDVMATECNNVKKGISAGGVPPYRTQSH